MMRIGLSVAKLVLWYLGFSASAHLVWETAQLPFYTIWTEGTRYQLVVAVLHCTGGDVLIAAFTLLAAILLTGRNWPAAGRARVACIAIALGIGYTIYSEWLNVTVRHLWTYSPLMPVVPPLGTGLSPLLQWAVIPFLAFLLLAWRVRRPDLAFQSAAHPC